MKCGTLTEQHQTLKRKFDTAVDMLTDRIGKMADESNAWRERVKELEQELHVEKQRRYSDRRRLGDYYLNSTFMDWPAQRDEITK